MIFPRDKQNSDGFKVIIILHNGLIRTSIRDVVTVIRYVCTINFEMQWHNFTTIMNQRF